VGHNYRLSNVLAGIGRGQLRVLKEHVKLRRSVYERYFTALSKVNGVDFMPEAPYGQSTRWLTALTVNPALCNVNTIDIIDALARENIEARPVWKPLHLQPLFRGCDYYPHSIDESISDKLYEKGICLPSGSDIGEEELSRVISCFINCFMNCIACS
jgi:pyridoxal phosphate-dependent aminotransferase EpsN